MKVLTKQADQDRAEFESAGCCSCHIDPPCNYCTHPGNPANQAEDESCWEDEPNGAPDSSEFNPEDDNSHP